MTSGELLTRASVWLSLSGYAIGVVAVLLARGRPKWLAVARTWWTIGCLAMLTHLVFAFSVYHGWSQSAALRETARQTEEVVGLNWGGGLFINYVFVALWVIDVAWWWGRGLDAYQRRPRFLTGSWQGIFLFMVFNATVVFKTGPLRWIGLAFCACLVALWWRRKVAVDRVDFARRPRPD